LRIYQRVLSLLLITIIPTFIFYIDGAIQMPLASTSIFAILMLAHSINRIAVLEIIKFDEIKYANTKKANTLLFASAILGYYVFISIFEESSNIWFLFSSAGIALIYGGLLIIEMNALQISTNFISFRYEIFRIENIECEDSIKGFYIIEKRRGSKYRIKGNEEIRAIKSLMIMKVKET